MAPISSFQTTLFAQGEPTVVDAPVERLPLDDVSWIDLSRGWLAGADELLLELADRLDWQGGRRPMYGELVDEPRLHASLGLFDPSTPEVIREMAHAVEARYHEGFDATFASFYRDGHDSVAWHADRVGRHQVDPVVVVVSLGGPRRFHLRPMGGGNSVRVVLGSGDLLVMGGSCQHAWEHTVPKMAVASPRMSVTFRRAAHIDDGQWWHTVEPRQS